MIGLSIRPIFVSAKGSAERGAGANDEGSDGSIAQQSSYPAGGFAGKGALRGLPFSQEIRRAFTKDGKRAH